MELHIATSGWFYWEWKGRFYPDDVPTHRWFKHYAAQFDTVELNAPFYRWPKPATVKTWQRRAPDLFLYSVKVNRVITHQKRFDGCADLVRGFYQIAGGLGQKMGCFLFQMPPNFEFSPARLALILSQLDPAFRNVMEFRHPSWWIPEVFERMRERNITFCSISAPQLPDQVVVTSDNLYVRFHGPRRWFFDPYSDAELDQWAAKILAANPPHAWIYFNNTAEGSAIANAFALRQRLLEPGSSLPNGEMRRRP